MNSSPDSNHNPDGGENNKMMSEEQSLDRKISWVARPTDVRPNDVLCGRSKTSFNHVGNRRFRSIVTAALDEYIEAASKWAKSMVAAKLVAMINAEGGRFLKQKKGNEEDFYELSAREAKAKVSHAIRDAIAAKDKTKANKTATPVAAGALAVKQTTQEAPQDFNLVGNVHDQFHLGGDSSSNRPMIPNQQLLNQNISLTSMAHPMFAVGAPQNFGCGTNIALDQIQHVQAQAVGATSSPFGDNSLAGTGMGLSAYHMQQPWLSQQPVVAALRMMPDTTFPTQLQLPHNLQAGLRPLPQDGLQYNITGTQSSQTEDATMARNGSSETEDGDTEFLSLIDTVLGPLQNPDDPAGKNG